MRTCKYYWRYSSHLATLPCCESMKKSHLGKSTARIKLKVESAEVLRNQSFAMAQREMKSIFRSGITDSVDHVTSSCPTRYTACWRDPRTQDQYITSITYLLWFQVGRWYTGLQSEGHVSTLVYLVAWTCDVVDRICNSRSKYGFHFETLVSQNFRTLLSGFSKVWIFHTNRLVHMATMHYCRPA